MALSNNSLESKIINNLTSRGFRECEQNRILAHAIASAVVDELKENATVVVASGSSAGSYNIS